MMSTRDVLTLTWGNSGWEIIAEDESKDADQHGSLGNLDSSPGTSSHKMGHGSSGESQMSFPQFIYFVNSENAMTLINPTVPRLGSHCAG